MRTQLEPAFTRWLADAEGFGHLGAEDRAALVARLRDSRPGPLPASFTPHDLRDVVLRARRRAELTARDRVAEVRATCWPWSAYLRFLVETGRWGPGCAAALGADLEHHLRPRREGPLARGSGAGPTSVPLELRQLRRTRLVQEAEDVLRGRGVGSARARAQLQRLGLLTAAGDRGEHRPRWDSPREEDAAAARRRLVVDEVVRVVRADPTGEALAEALALTTSSVPPDVAEGSRRLAVLVGAGRASALVEAGVLPQRAPWRIARGLHPAVHVALTRLVDDEPPTVARASVVVAAAGG